MRHRFDEIDAITECLKLLRLRPPSHIPFKTIASAPQTTKFSKHELLNALYALEYEGAIAVHHDLSFSVLKPHAAL